MDISLISCGFVHRNWCHCALHVVYIVSRDVMSNMSVLRLAVAVLMVAVCKNMPLIERLYSMDKSFYTNALLCLI